MKYAQDGFVDKAEHWLLKAEDLVKNNDKLAVIYHSNLACIYKNKPNLDKA